MDPTFPLFPIFAGIGCVVILIPLPWHLEAWNSGTCYFIFWTFLGCLNQLVNSIVWRNNALNVAPIWCDISTRIIIAASVGIPAASLSINRRLYLISRCRAATVTIRDKRRAIFVDSMICLVFPLIYLVMEYVVQGHRFNIFEQLGCYPAVYNVLPAYFLVNMWPVLIGLVSAVYCFLSLKNLASRRAAFREYLTSGTSLTGSRYLRLMALAMTDILLDTPLGIYEIYSNAIAGPIQPWISWEDTHFDFSHVEQFPAVIWRGEPLLNIPLELSRWLIVVCALVFFAFFGFAEEARRNYRAAWTWITGKLGFRRSQNRASAKGAKGEK
ncbi:fungal pheromone STE3G-protein-coupled receptor [Polyporus arcularius HHB13444]|uniref:Fungal pheromone STE3G-protein-coupled receptor n=1 Tax=Polyporus arcularius HHB13444 TaxID=1314778 RepID=A0A5C3PFL1_9APHY|nr:fungal pheromone STE3G-protein-coupled receptor [Polyporus arcularius HHB13444]